MREPQFKNKTVIVTGSGMGIGKAIAQEFCEQGARVVLNGRNAERLEKTHQHFLQKGFSAIAIQADVTLPKECERLIQKTIEAFGTIDILINNAGISMRDRFEHLRPEVFSMVIESNIMGSAFPTLKALPYIKQTKGSIVFISSAAGMIGLPAVSAYSAGKMALTALAQSLKIEFSGSNIHIGIAYLGFTKNDDEKRTLNANGDPTRIPKRHPRFVQSQETVALAVLRMVRKRKFKVTLSALGKLNALLVRFFPSLVIWIISASEKRMGLINESSSK